MKTDASLPISTRYSTDVSRRGSRNCFIFHFSFQPVFLPAACRCSCECCTGRLFFSKKSKHDRDRENWEMGARRSGKLVFSCYRTLYLLTSETVSSFVLLFGVESIHHVNISGRRMLLMEFWRLDMNEIKFLDNQKF